MGKRRSCGRSQLLSTMTKKQKKHLRDFGEEHPFYDRSGRAGLRRAGPGRRGSVGSGTPAAAGVRPRKGLRKQDVEG